MKLVRCQKCGTVVISDDTFLQNILDAMEEACRKARRAKSGYEKNVALHEAAEYKAMYRSFMHHLTERDKAEHNVDSFVIKELYHHLVDSGKLTDAEFLAIQKRAETKAKAVRAAEEKEINAIYGNFETICNRTMPSPTERAALKNCR
jgi:hypothetical protein